MNLISELEKLVGKHKKHHKKSGKKRSAAHLKKYQFKKGHKKRG